VWLSQYTQLMFKISKNAYLELDICGHESWQNMEEFTKVNISNFSFLAGAVGCKFIMSTMLMCAMMGLLSQE